MAQRQLKVAGKVTTTPNVAEASDPSVATIIGTVGTLAQDASDRIEVMKHYITMIPVHPDDLTKTDPMKEKNPSAALAVMNAYSDWRTTAETAKGKLEGVQKTLANLTSVYRKQAETALWQLFNGGVKSTFHKQVPNLKEILERGSEHEGATHVTYCHTALDALAPFLAKKDMSTSREKETETKRKQMQKEMSPARQMPRDPSVHDKPGDPPLHYIPGDSPARHMPRDPSVCHMPGDVVGQILSDSDRRSRDNRHHKKQKRKVPCWTSDSDSDGCSDDEAKAHRYSNPPPPPPPPFQTQDGKRMKIKANH